MKKCVLISIALAALAPTAMAVTYNDTITAIFGSGNPDTGWTSETSGDIKLALRAKGRNDTSFAGTTPNNGAGTYIFPALEGARGSFNYEFSISGTSLLSTYSYFLAVDRDPSAGTSFVTIDPLAYWNDNSYGTDTTANGAGIEGPAALALLSTVAQNSQNITFSDYPGGPLALDANATYTFQLYAVSAGARGILASLSIDVVIGQGGARVPDVGSALGLLGLGMIGLVGIRHWKR